MQNKSTKEQVFEAILAEREYQDEKYGTLLTRPREMGTWLTLIWVMLTRAEEDYVGHDGDGPALDELRKVAALCVACMEQHGAVYR